MRKLFLVVAIAMAFAVSFVQAQEVQKSFDVVNHVEWNTKIYGDVVLLFNTNNNPDGVRGLVVIEINDRLYKDYVVFNESGFAKSEIYLPGRIDEGSYRIIVTTPSGSHSNYYELRLTPSPVYWDYWTWGTAVGAY